MLSETNVLIFSLLGGIVPALFWIWFWIREDRLRPEPKSALLAAFLGGILAVLFALFLELIIYYLLADASTSIEKQSPSLFWVPLENLADKYNLIDWQAHFWTPIQNFFNNWDWAIARDINAKKFFLVVIMAPLIEEILKLFFTYNICLRRKVNDEPIDAAIYMLTTALGFAAVETALFLTAPLAKGNFFDSLIATNFRAIAPMLIHLVSSAFLGIFIGLAFYKNKLQKAIYLLFGLFVAFILHSLFNLFIVLNESTHDSTFFWSACFETWALVVILLIFFEKVKKVARKRRWGMV